MVVLERPAIAFGIDIVANGGTFAGDGFVQNFADYGVQFSYAKFRERFGQGMDAGAVKCFVGVNVSQAADEFLVEQQSLHAGGALAQPLGESFQVDFEGVRA
jgi:hypothetical protein